MTTYRFGWWGVMPFFIFVNFWLCCVGCGSFGICWCFVLRLARPHWAGEGESDDMTTFLTRYHHWKSCTQSCSILSKRRFWCIWSPKVSDNMTGQWELMSDWLVATGLVQKLCGYWWFLTGHDVDALLKNIYDTIRDVYLVKEQMLINAAAKYKSTRYCSK